MTLSRPQRISRPEPPGSLLKRITVAALRRVQAEPKGGDPAYLAQVRQLPCLKCGMEPSEAAHVRFASAAFGKASGMQKKPLDAYAVPLCASCHRLDRDAQHSRGERMFWAELGINPLLVAQRLYVQRGDLVAMRAVVMVAIAERRTPEFYAAEQAAVGAALTAPPSSVSVPNTDASPGFAGAMPDAARTTAAAAPFPAVERAYPAPPAGRSREDGGDMP